MNKIIHLRLTKKEGEVKNVYGDIVNGYVVCMGKPVFSKEMLDQKGLLQKAKETSNLLDATSDLLECVFRIGKNRDGSIVERVDDEAIAQKKNEERRIERQKQNVFLKEKGYSWKKEIEYNPFHENEDEEFSEIWILRDKNRQKIFNVDNLLITLGYFGQETIQKRNQKIKAKEEKREVIEDIETFFRKNKGEYLEKVLSIDGQAYHVENKGHNIYGGGVGYIVTDNAIWKIENNGMDGDDWSRNNYQTGGAGAIAMKYIFNKEITEKIFMLSKGL